MPISRTTLLISAAVIAVLVAFASGYGYHRDELYFLAAGQNLDVGYADQGPITPLIARAMTEISAESLTILRLPSALMAGLTVLVTSLIARELGGTRRAQVIAAACAAVSSIVLVTGHLLSTSTFDLLVWTAITWLVVRALRTGDDRLWLVTGVVLGFGLLNKPLPAFLALGLLAGVAIAGPRELIRNPFVWAGALIALALWSPWLAWQASNGWPQLEVSEAIAAGDSASSEPWYLIVPFQFLLVSPLLAPVWIAGLVWLFRDREARRLRFFAWAWVTLAVIFMLSGGKPYYLAGLLPLLVGAGALRVDAWLDRGAERLRVAALTGAVVLSALIGGAIALPVLAAEDAGPVIALNEDVGETIGWPDFAARVAAVRNRLPADPDPVIFTVNYGEAGAIDRFGPDLGLPRAYSGQNAYWEWGPPADADAPVITIGLSRAEAAENFDSCVLQARVQNRYGIDNEESGAPILVCEGVRGSWSQRWPDLRRLG